MTRLMRTVLTAASISMLSLAAFADHHGGGHPKVTDLAWMTGSWDAPEGPSRLEENWGVPRGGTMVSLVKSTGPDDTSMIEIVSIEEANGTLELYLQQWDVPFASRTDGPQKMTLREQTANSITFDAVTEGGIKTLKYLRPADDEFHVDVTIATGQNFVLKLKARQ